MTAEGKSSYCTTARSGGLKTRLMSSGTAGVRSCVKELMASHQNVTGLSRKIRVRLIDSTFTIFVHLMINKFVSVSRWCYYCFEDSWIISRTEHQFIRSFNQ